MPRTPLVPTSPSSPPQRTTSPLYQPFAGHTPEVVEGALERILASKTFRRSQRHQEFLRHVVGAALDGRYDELREIAIGLDVFGRPASTYDPRRDPIVRVEAGRVREKLARYYADEGARDTFEIQIPVGGYLPQLARRTSARAVARNLGSYAVLPFTNLSPHPADAQFSEALADQLVDQLSRVPGVRVVGRMSAAKAHAHSADLKVVGKLLGVTHAIEGSLQRAGARYRLIAQIVRVRDRVCVWSQRFEGSAGEGADVFAFQDHIADTVTQVIAQPETPAEPVAPPPPRLATTNPTARDLFERARYLVQLRTVDSLERAIGLLDSSIALDAEFAPAWSQLGVAKSALYGLMARPTLAAFRDVESCARRALELDPLDGDARVLIANIAFRIEFDWAKAEPLYREALRVAPNSAYGHQFYAAALVFNGRHLEAMQHARIALDLDPLNLTVRIHLAVISSYARDYKTTEEEFKAVLDVDPNHFYAHIMLGTAYLWAGAQKASLRHFEAANRSAPNHPIPLFNYVFRKGFIGEIGEGRRMLDELVVKLEGQLYQLYNRAMAEAFLGNVQGACDVLRMSAEARELLFTSAPADPSFDRIRDHPQFVALMRAYGLPTALPPSPFASKVKDC